MCEGRGGLWVQGLNRTEADGIGINVLSVGNTVAKDEIQPSAGIQGTPKSTRLQQVVAELILDKAMLKDVLEKILKYWGNRLILHISVRAIRSVNATPIRRSV